MDDEIFKAGAPYSSSYLDEQLAKAESNLTKSRHTADMFRSFNKISVPDYQLKRTFDEVTGKATYELVEGTKDIAVPRLDGARRTARNLYYEGKSRIHGKISEYEEDNQGVEAFHKVEKVGEEAFERARRLMPSGENIYRKVSRELNKQAKNAEKEYNRTLFDKKLFDTTGKTVFNDTKKLTKEQLAKKAKEEAAKKAAREISREVAKESGKVAVAEGTKAGVTAATTTGATVTAGATTATVATEGTVAANGVGLATGVEEVILIVIAALIVLVSLILLIVFIVGSLWFLSTNVLASIYPSEPTDIEQAELHMTYLEANLEEYMRTFNEDYPDYDGYVLERVNTGHNPFTLINYLSAKYEDFTYSEVEDEINDLFNEMYKITLYVETVEFTKPLEEGDPGPPETVELEILHLKVTKTSLDTVVAGRMNSEEKERNDLYEETQGGLQCFASPIDGDWYSKVSCYYGYRIHPINNSFQIHRGVDIAIPEGTNLYAGLNGTVTTVGNDPTGYGNYVVITDAEGNQCKYAHMKQVIVTTGSAINKGDLLGYSGNTGSSTGPHVHIECLKNGEYYNPIFYFESN